MSSPMPSRAPTEAAPGCTAGTPNTRDTLTTAVTPVTVKRGSGAARMPFLTVKGDSAARQRRCAHALPDCQGRAPEARRRQGQACIGSDCQVVSVQPAHELSSLCQRHGQPHCARYGRPCAAVPVCMSSLRSLQAVFVKQRLLDAGQGGQGDYRQDAKAGALPRAAPEWCVQLQTRARARVTTQPP